MLEIEVKILEIDKESVISRLEYLGATKVFEGVISARHYDFDDKSLTRNGGFLRLRSKGDSAELTFKDKKGKGKAKVAKETETRVSSFKSMDKILTKLGMYPVVAYKKHRVSYQLGDAHLELDTYPGVPTFLEIEAPSYKKVKSVAKKLGFSEEELKPWSGKDVLKYYGKL